MKSNNALIAVALIGGGLFLASRARAEEAGQPVPPAAVLPIIPGTGGATAATPAAAPGGGMAPSKAAVDLIKKNTGFLPLPKAEPSGAVIIGYGHKVVEGDPVDWKNLALKTPLTPEQADALFLNDLLKHVEVINRLVSVPLNQNQYDALSSLVMNIGAENFAFSTLLKRLNEKDYAGAGEQFLVWNKSRGANKNLVVNDGLTARRAGERTLFLTPVVEVAGATPPTVPDATTMMPVGKKKNMIVEMPGKEIGEGQWNPTLFIDEKNQYVKGFGWSNGMVTNQIENTKMNPATIIGYWKDLVLTDTAPVIVMPTQAPTASGQIPANSFWAQKPETIYKAN